MVERKNETFTYTDLGFPIELTDVPMRKMLGEWVLDINLNTFQIEVLKMLIHKPTQLHSGAFRFIRKYFEMTTTTFGDVFGVSHAAVNPMGKRSITSASHGPLHAHVYNGSFERKEC